MSKSMKGFGRAGLSALATSTLVIGACAAFVAPANADSTFQFSRVSGHDRYDVSAAVADQYGAADHVILASGEQGKYADSLAANYLSGAINAPILLTQLNSTPDATMAAIKKSGATKITIVGGPLSVSQAQQDALTQAGYTVDRIEGHTRYDVDAAVIKAASKTGDTAIIATGEKFPDALAAGPVSYAKNLPIGLVTLGTAPSQVLDALKASGVKNAIVLGGDLSVSQETRQQITNAGIKIVAELNGGNRAAVATQLADYEIANYGFSKTKANVATGRELSQGADALSAGPLTGKQARPLLITAGDPQVGTQQATGPDLLNWLSNHAQTLTGTDNLLFGGPLSISDAQKTLMEQAAQTPANGNSSNVSVSSSSVQAGAPITGSITGNNIKSASVSGPCVANPGTVQDTNSTQDGIQFSIPTNGNASGSCTVTFTTTYNDGSTSVSNQTVTVTAPSSATTRPELTSAKIVSTTTVAQSNNGNPAGTTVQYTFDEPVGNAGSYVPVPSDFHLVSSSDVPVDGNAIQNVSGSTVTVLFQGVNATTGSATFTSNGAQAPANANNYTLATVSQNAVTDLQGQTNPEGDAAVGSASSTGTTAQAGVTNAPDLTKVSGFRQDSTGTGTAVDFTFDQPATLVAGVAASKFNLVTDNGTVVPGQTISTSTSTPGGTNVPGGNGTTTITVIFPDGASGVGTIQPADIARGYVGANAVTDSTGTYQNPLEAAPVGSNTTGATNAPNADLVSAQFIPAGTGTNTGTTDQVLYTFDRALTTPPTTGAVNAGYKVFNVNGVQNSGGTVTSVSSDNKQVLVDFGKGGLTDVVGANVNNTAGPNVQADSTGVTPVRTSTTSQTPGRVDGPDLTNVKINTTTDVFGTKSSTATYTFDQAVGVGPFANFAKFHLYRADGVEMTATSCAAPSNATATNTDVVCKFANDTQAHIASATLGTVERGAVSGDPTSANQNQNPIGAEFTTGGTGTPTA